MVVAEVNLRSKLLLTGTHKQKDGLKSHLNSENATLQLKKANSHIINYDNYIIN